MNEATLVWVDLETTGLDPTGDAILEVAVGASPMGRPFDVEILFEQVLHFSRRTWDAPVDDKVEEMHTQNGIWLECLNADLEEQDLDGFLCEKIFFHLPHLRARDLYLAGSAVYFDASFLDRSAPKFASLFSHRHYDVSAVKLFCESLGMPKIPKGEAHRARADILESAHHARKCAYWLAQNYGHDMDAQRCGVFGEQPA